MIFSSCPLCSVMLDIDHLYFLEEKNEGLYLYDNFMKASSNKGVLSLKQFLEIYNPQLKYEHKVEIITKFAPREMLFKFHIDLAKIFIPYCEYLYTKDDRIEFAIKTMENFVVGISSISDLMTAYYIVRLGDYGGLTDTTSLAVTEYPSSEVNNIYYDYLKKFRLHGSRESEKRSFDANEIIKRLTQMQYIPHNSWQPIYLAAEWYKNYGMGLEIGFKRQIEIIRKYCCCHETSDTKTYSSTGERE